VPATSASQLIFFIAAMVVATAVAGIFITTTINLAKDMRSAAKEQADEFNTHVTVINDGSAMPYNSTCSTLVVYILNTRSVVIDENSTRILIDGGTYFGRDNMTFTLLDGATEWKAETVLQVTMTNVTLSAGDHTLKVIVQGGVFTTFSFKV
jgi:archaellum component FlaG (FlaF/FlaG flagellin family)